MHNVFAGATCVAVAQGVSVLATRRFHELLVALAGIRDHLKVKDLPAVPLGRYRGFSRQWLQGYRRIYVVRLTDRIFAWTLRRGHIALCPLAVVLAGVWPAILNVVLLVAAPSLAVRSARAMLWLVGMGVVATLMLLSGWGAWTYLFRRAHKIDEIFERSPDRSRVELYLKRRMLHRWQLAVPLLAAMSSLLYLAVFRSSDETALASYLGAAWTTFLAGHAANWLYVVTGVSRRAYHCRNLNLVWQDPASTPGLRAIAEGYGLAALFLLVGVLAILVLGFLLPGSLARSSTRAVLSIIFGIAVLLSFRVGPYAFFWIYAVVRREKRQVLALIQGRIPDIRTVASCRYLAPDLRWSEAYRIVRSAPDLPFGTSALLQYSAVLLAASLAFVVNIIID